VRQDFLLQAIGEIDDSLILDAEQAPAAPVRVLRSVPRRWRYWGGLAAALVVCIGLWAGIASGVLPGLRIGSESSATAPTSPSCSGGAPAPSGEPIPGDAASASNGSPGPGGGTGPSSDESFSGNQSGPASPSASAPPSEVDGAGESLILLFGGWYVPGNPPDGAFKEENGTVLGTLACPAWGFGSTNDAPETGSEDGTLLTNVPEYAGLTVWEADGRYFLELADGSFLTLIPRTD